MSRRESSRLTSPESARPGGARLWAPWRAAYLTKARAATPECIFCFSRTDKRSLRVRLVLYAGPLAVVMLNRYPYNNGHLMISPRRHVATPELLTREERATIGELQALVVDRLRRALRPDGINLGANLGRAAGAGFADHMHWHAVPRWEGDTNFMPVVGSTRVLSQHLEESFALLAPHFKAIDTALS
jgi:ATP adenylyltransferase